MKNKKYFLMVLVFILFSLIVLSMSSMAKIVSYQTDAEVVFDPAKYNSTAMITVGSGSPISKEVTGKALLQYSFDKIGNAKHMKIISMYLTFDSFNTRVGTFSKNRLYLLSVPDAYCVKQSGGFKPCDIYEIKQKTFSMVLNNFLDGEKSFFYGKNDLGKYLIDVDHKNRNVIIKGTLNTSLRINGKQVPTSLDINIKGHFTSFVPVAVSKESQKEVRCGGPDTARRDTNKDPVVLYASGSYDFYDILPTNTPNYRFFQDYRLVTEKEWSTGWQQSDKVTIPPGELSFGVNHFTLLVKDKDGLVGENNFTVTVYDNQMPNLQIPADKDQIWLLASMPPKGIYVDIGSASSSGDNCSETVMISNDAPENNLFPPNKETIVTWVADDGKGNLREKKQKVKVNVALMKRFDPLQINDFLSYIKSTMTKNEALFKNCIHENDCSFDQLGVERLVQQFKKSLSAIDVNEREKVHKQQLLTEMDTIQMSIRQSKDLSERANAVPNLKERVKFRKNLLNQRGRPLRE